MSKPTINIRCEAAVNINLADLTQLQGDLKELSEGNFNKLKTSILKHGITFPFFVWQNQSVNYILDGTQRDRVLKRMIEEGYQVPPLPCALIQAKDRKEVSMNFWRKMILASSNFLMS